MRRNLHSIDIQSFKHDLSTCLASISAVSDLNFPNLVSSFNDCLLQCLDKHAPLKASAIKYKKRPPWLDHEYVIERAKRRKLERQYKKSQSSQHKNLYMAQRQLCSDIAKSKRHKYYSDIISKNAGDQKVLFSIVNKLLDRSKHASSLPDHSDPLALANSFNSFFIEKIEKIRDSITKESPVCAPSSSLHKDASCYIEQGTALSSIDECNQLIPDDSLTHFEPATNDEIKCILKESGVKVSPSDPVPAYLLVECIDDLIPFLTVLVNASLSCGSVDGIKEAMVRPLLKKSGLDYDTFQNYRPISNLSFISKLVERVVLVRLNAHMAANNLHNDNQYGYKKFHSTETLLLKFMNDILIAVDKQFGVVVLLIDLSAAFDTVDHKLLLSILYHDIGIKGTALKWFHSFLVGRSQRVIVGNSLSEPAELTCGVPQGSVLGPVLFNIYTSSLSNAFKSAGFTSSGYADDNSGFRMFSLAFQLEVLTQSVPNCLKHIKEWMDSHMLKLNKSKTEIIVFGDTSFVNSQIINGTFCDSGECIRFAKTIKYLGMYIDNYLNFDIHISNIVSSCYMNLRNISSVRRFLSQSHAEILVHAFISSRLDMCNSLFFGMSRKNIGKLQKVQNAAMRVIKYKKKRDSVQQYFHELHWLNIDQRISFKILLLVFKCIYGLAPHALANCIFIKDPDKLLLEVSTFFSKSKYGNRAFSFYAPRQWNALPQDIRLIDNITTFKGRVKHFMFSHFDTFKSNYNKYVT